jgi:hypothetical protein
VGPAEDDLDPLADLADVEDDGADALAGVVALAGNLLAPGQEGVGLAQVDRDGAPLERWTVPVIRSPRWSSNSSKRLSRSASRIFWMMTCLAVWAAIRPNSEGSILAPSLTASMSPDSGSMLTTISSASG